MNIFYEDFADNFWGHHKIGLYLVVISMHFKIFSLGQLTEWGIFLGVAQISNIFGVLKIPDFFFFFGEGGGGAVDAWPEPTYERKK